MIYAGTPAKLRDGTWGARVQGTPKGPGHIVHIRTRGGKEWDARITAVLWTGDGVALCRTESLDRLYQPSSGAKPSSGPYNRGECQCGACEDLLSQGYRPGQRIRCPECGGWAEPN